MPQSRMVSTDATVHAGTRQAVVSISSAVFLIISCRTEAFESSVLVDACRPIPTNISQLALINIERTSRSSVSRSTSTSEPIDEISAGPIVEARIGPTVIEVCLAPGTSCPWRADASVSLSLSIQNLEVKLCAVDGLPSVCRIGGSCPFPDQVDTSPPEQTGRGEALVDSILTEDSSETNGTLAGETVDPVDACPSIDTRRVAAVVDVVLAVGSIESWRALADVGVQGVLACPSVHAGIGSAVVDVVLAVGSSEPWRTDTLVTVDLISADPSVLTGI